MDVAVAETAFEQSYPAIRRLAAVRAATVVILYRLPTDSRHDLEQELSSNCGVRFHCSTRDARVGARSLSGSLRTG